MAKRGRPSKIEQGLIDRICANIALAVPFKYAVEREGISEATAYEWIRKAEAGDDTYVGFSIAVTRARAEAVAKLVGHTLAGGRGSMGAQFHLERQFRQYFGPTQRIEHSGPDGKAIEVHKSISDMSDEELSKIAGVEAQ